MGDTPTTEETLASILQQNAELGKNLDVFFLVINAIIIYFMQCGFAFLECGAVRSKNATNILIKNILDSFVAGVSYWLFGYAFAFGKGNFFLGYTNFASYGLDTFDLATWFFHFVFAATAATIVSGAMAERCQFSAYLIYSIIITGLVYPVVTHWAWSSEGWLANGLDFDNGNGTMVNVAYQDFAGSGVVHLLGGTCALVGAVFLGPRLGRFSNGSRNSIRGHSVPLAALGGFILFAGFFSFNGGSQASISVPGDGGAIALSVANTIISGSFAAMTAMITHKIALFVHTDEPTWSLLTTVNGALTGMVAICAGCNAVHPWAAAVIGIVAGWTFLFWNWFVSKIRVDDPLDAVAVHGGGGLWGVIAVPIFAKSSGIIYNFDKASFMGLAWNLVGAIAIIGWSAIICIIMFGFLKLFKSLRVDPEVERKGLDIPKHGEPAYPTEAYGDGWSANHSLADEDTLLRRRTMQSVQSNKTEGVMMPVYAANTVQTPAYTHPMNGMGMNGQSMKYATTPVHYPVSYTRTSQVLTPTTTYNARL